jgi:ABC-type branched-subunit amino acid transport system ATPase component
MPGDETGLGTAGSSPVPPGQTPVLETRDLTKRFGGVVAVREVTLALPHVGVYGLCGLNGAGKSTLFNLLAGALRADGGSVSFEGSDVTGLSASKRARLGIARTWQMVHLAGQRTVLDNVAVACLPSPSQSMILAPFRTQLKDARERARVVLDDLGLWHMHNRLAGTLTLEGQRLTELARAVADDPKVLLADEPASGLSGTQRSALADTLVHLGESRAVMLVEHDLDMLERISQYLWAMLDGGIAFAGKPEEFAGTRAHAALRGIQAARRTTDLRSLAVPGDLTALGDLAAPGDEGRLP